MEEQNFNHFLYRMIVDVTHYRDLQPVLAELRDIWAETVGTPPPAHLLSISYLYDWHLTVHEHISFVVRCWCPCRFCRRVREPPQQQQQQHHLPARAASVL